MIPKDVPQPDLDDAFPIQESHTLTCYVKAIMLPTVPTGKFYTDQTGWFPCTAKQWQHLFLSHVLSWLHYHLGQTASKLQSRQHPRNAQNELLTDCDVPVFNVLLLCWTTDALLLFNSSYMINQYSSRRHQLTYTEAMLLNALFESSKIISLLDSAQWMKHSLCTYGINFWHKLNWLSTCSAVHEWIQNLLPGNNCIASLATMQHCLDLPAHESWYMTNCRTVVLGHLMDKIPGTLVCHWITIAVTLFGCRIHVMNGKPTLSPGSRNRSQC